MITYLSGFLKLRVIPNQVFYTIQIHITDRQAPGNTL